MDGNLIWHYLPEEPTIEESNNDKYLYIVAYKNNQNEIEYIVTQYYHERVFHDNPYLEKYDGILRSGVSDPRI